MDGDFFYFISHYGHLGNTDVEYLVERLDHSAILNINSKQTGFNIKIQGWMQMPKYVSAVKLLMNWTWQAGKKIDQE